jgi:hypothetical protein
MSNIEEITNRFNGILVNYNREKEKLSKEVILELTSTFKSIVFDRYPEIESIGWNQETPEWNDGEPCTFIVNYDCVSLNDCPWQDIANKIDYKAWFDVDEVEPPVPYDIFNELCEKISNILSGIPEELLETLGEGDITLTRDLTYNATY